MLARCVVGAHKVPAAAMFFRSAVSSTRMFGTSAARSQPGKLEGKVAVITASTEGIGFAIAKRLGLDGAKVVVSSRKQKNVDHAVEELQKQNISVLGMTCHVAKAEDRKKLIEETTKAHGGIDILVANAGINPVFGPILDTTEEQWDKIMDTNVKCTFLLCKETVPHMEKRGGGSIVLVSSITGYVPSPAISAYSVSKTALLGLTKALAPQCAEMNIRVNCIAPGIIDTNFSSALTQNPQIAKGFTGSLAIKRFGKPDDCAGTVSFLVSEDASYITGETILITGGAPARL